MPEIPEVLKPLIALVLVVGVLGLVVSGSHGSAGFGVGNLSAPSTVAIRQTEGTAPVTTSTTDVPTPTTALPTGEPMNDSSTAAAQRVSRALFDGINRERRIRNEPNLKWDDSLATQAAAWSSHLAGQDLLEHRTITGGASSVEPGLSVFGENIYRSKSGVPALSIHDAWMGSAEHRQNILQPGFDRAGVGVYCAADGSVWATQEFGGGSGSDLTTAMPAATPVAWTTGNGPTCN